MLSKISLGLKYNLDGELGCILVRKTLSMTIKVGFDVKEFRWSPNQRVITIQKHRYNPFIVVGFELDLMLN